MPQVRSRFLGVVFLGSSVFCVHLVAGYMTCERWLSEVITVYCNFFLSRPSVLKYSVCLSRRCLVCVEVQEK